jgi:hypothetical protein
MRVYANLCTCTAYIHRLGPRDGNKHSIRRYQLPKSASANEILYPNPHPISATDTISCPHPLSADNRYPQAYPFAVAPAEFHTIAWRAGASEEMGRRERRGGATVGGDGEDRRREKGCVVAGGMRGSREERGKEIIYILILSWGGPHVSCC